MSGDYLANLRGCFTPGTNAILLTDGGIDDLRAALDELEKLRVQTREEIERRSYAVTHAKVCEEKCDQALAEVKQLQAGRIPLMVLRQAWRNGWTDRGNAIRQTAADADRQRDDYERAFVRYMSEDPAEDDKDPYRPVDGPDDPAFEQQPAPTVAELHARCAHPSYEYATTQGPRKSWDGYDDPPEGDGWERNADVGRDGWERFDYHEESYWRRLRPDTTCGFPTCGRPDHQATSDLNGGDEQ